MKPLHWTTEQRKISDLTPHPDNPRLMTAKQDADLDASLEKFNLAEIPAINTDGMILAGHQRLRKMIEHGRGDEVIDVRVPSRPLTEDEAREYLIRSNKNTGDWDWDELANHFDESELEGWGFDEEELTGLDIPPEETDLDAPADLDKADELQQKWGTKTGQLWRLGEHRLLCGDATNPNDVSKCLDGVVPMLMVTDPPYGVEYDPTWRADAGVNNNTKKMGKVKNDDIVNWSAAWALFPGDVVYVYHDGTKASIVQTSVEQSGFEVRAQIIWAKDRMALSRGDYHWQHEPCWYAVRHGKPGLRNDDRTQTTLWTIASRDDSGHGHSTQKPVECIARPIRNHDSEYVYDPFCGSGTTIIACENLGRKCRALEISPGYVGVILQRYMDATGIEPELMG